MVASPERMTAGRLSAYEDPADRRVVLVRGRLLVSEPPGDRHGVALVRVSVSNSLSLSLCVREATPAGAPPVREVAAGDPGFWIARNPDTVRAPEVAFVAADPRARRARPP